MRSHRTRSVLLVCIFSCSGVSPGRAQASCGMVNFCSGHGKCVPETGSCTCDAGFGASTDTFDGPIARDCSQRVCPSGRAWGSVPISSTAAHAMAECSNQGVCDRATGVCTCVAGFTGKACQNRHCPNDCSGHGRCLPMINLARRSDAEPLVSTGSLPYSAVSYEYSDSLSSTTWDQYTNFACVCDSTWAVGLGNGETQLSEWTGPDCSLKRCPSGNDLLTDSTDETDCASVLASGGRGYGATGNLCYVPCSNRGVCDYSSGDCSCFPGHYGVACELGDALAAA